MKEILLGRLGYCCLSEKQQLLTLRRVYYWFTAVVLVPVYEASASPGNFMEMHILRPYSRLTEPETVSAGPSNLYFNNPSRWLWWEHLSRQPFPNTGVQNRSVRKNWKTYVWFLSFTNCNLQWVTISSCSACPNYITDKTNFLLHKEILKISIWKLLKFLRDKSI